MGKSLPDQFPPRHAHQIGGGGVGLHDQALRIEGDIAHGCQVEDMEIARPLGFQRRLHPPQFLILHFQFDLVDAQFVESRPQVFW